MAALVAAGALVELCAACYVLAVGPFVISIGPVRASATHALQPLSVSAIAACLAIVLDELTGSASAILRSRLITIIVLVTALAGGISLAAPLLLPGFPLAHDAGAHPTHAFQFNRAILEGQLPVRWVEWIQHGVGQPLFNYYQVGFYYLVELVHALGLPLSLAVKLTIAVCWLSGAGFMFLLFKPRGLWPAVLAASVFVWSPYLMLDAYVRGDYPELAAIALAPGALWSIDRLLRWGRPRHVFGLALVIGLLLVTHLLAAMVILPLCAAYTLARIWTDRSSSQRLHLVLTGTLLGVGLASFYLVPAIGELSAINISRLTSSYFDYHQHFVSLRQWFDWSWGYGGSGAVTDHPMSIQLGVVQWLVLVSAVLLIAIAAARRRLVGTHVSLAGWLAATAVSLFLMTSASTPIWESIAMLRFIQFPWRLLMLPAIACAALSALIVSMVRSRTRQALIVLAVVLLQWSVTRDYRHEAWRHQRVNMCIDQSLDAWSAECEGWAFRESAFDPTAASEATPSAARWSVIAGDGVVSPNSMKQVNLALTVHAVTPVELVINTPFSPGWRVALDDHDLAPDVQPRSGYMKVAVPAGDHLVSAQFGRTPIRAFSEGLSVMSLCALAVLMFRAHGRRTRPI